MDYHNGHQNGRAHIILYSSNIQGGTANLLSIRPPPWKHPIWTPLVDTHIIHKPSHHQERPPASPVGHIPYNGWLSRRGLRTFTAFPLPFPNHRTLPRNESRITVGPVAPHRSDWGMLRWRQAVVYVLHGHYERPFWMEHMRVLLGRLLWQDILIGKQICPLWSAIVLKQTVRTKRMSFLWGYLDRTHWKDMQIAGK